MTRIINNPVHQQNGQDLFLRDFMGKRLDGGQRHIERLAQNNDDHRQYDHEYADGHIDGQRFVKHDNTYKNSS